MSFIDILKTSNVLIQQMNVGRSSESVLKRQIKQISVNIHALASSGTTTPAPSLKERVKILHLRAQISKKFDTLLSNPGSFAKRYVWSGTSKTKTAIETILEDSARLVSFSEGKEIFDLVKNQKELETLLELPPALSLEEKIQAQIQLMENLSSKMTPEEKNRLALAWTEGLFTALGHAEYIRLLETMPMKSYIASLTTSSEMEKSLSDCPELARLYETYGTFYRNEQGENLLHLACKLGNEAWINFLLKQGCDPECKSSAAETPLHYAAAEGNPKIVSALLTHGATIQSNLAGSDPTHMAATNGHTSILQLFADHGISLNKQDAKGRTPLYLAAENKHDTTCEHLLSIGADARINPKSSLPNLLSVAIDNNLERFAAKFIPMKIDLLKIDFFFRLSPLRLACDKNRTYIAKLLIEHGGIPSERAKAIVHSVVHNDNLEILKEIEKHDPTLLDINLTEEEDVYTLAYFLCKEKILAYLDPKPKSRFYIEAKNLAAFSGIDTVVSHKGMTFRSLLSHPYPYYKRCAEAVPDSLTEIKTAMFEASKKRRSVDEMFETAKSGKLLVIPTGWKKHAASIVTNGEVMIICNRGDRPAGCPALLGFHINNPANFTKELLESIVLIEEKGEDEACDFLYGTLFSRLFARNSLLDMNTRYDLEEIAPKDQKVENCCAAAAKTAIRACLYLKAKESGMSLAEVKAMSKKITSDARRMAESSCESLASESPEFAEPLMELVATSRSKRKGEE